MLTTALTQTSSDGRSRPCPSPRSTSESLTLLRSTPPTLAAFQTSSGCRVLLSSSCCHAGMRNALSRLRIAATISRTDSRATRLRAVAARRGWVNMMRCAWARTRIGLMSFWSSAVGVPALCAPLLPCLCSKCASAPSLAPAAAVDCRVIMTSRSAHPAARLSIAPRHAPKAWRREWRAGTAGVGTGDGA